MMRLRQCFFVTLFLVSMFFLAGTSAHADDEELLYKDIKYACTGVAESKEDPRWAQYPLKLMFTTGGRAYISYVEVKIVDENQKLVFEANCDAPWLVVGLKPGTYQAKVVALKQYTREVSLGISAGKQLALAVRFPEISGSMH